MGIRVATYNALSPFLCNEYVFPNYAPEALDPSRRFETVRAKLQSEVNQQAIICLQEVCYKWAGSLYEFFLQRRYQFLFLPYGHAHNGYMGVGVAFPEPRYALLHCEFIRVGDHVAFQEEPQQATEGASFLRVPPYDSNRHSGGTSSGLLDLHATAVPTSTSMPTEVNKPAEDGAMWDLSARRNNVVIVANLQDRQTGLCFFLATYHMPCMWQIPQVMVIHASLLVQALQAVAQGAPLILAGDFNFLPGSAPYRLLTTGCLDPQDPAYPPTPPPGMPYWKPTDLTPLRSAYLAYFGTEPAFTNYCQPGYFEPLRGTLDYIFCSAGVTVEAARSLPLFDDTVPVQPSMEEPSDHLLISATFRLGATTEEGELTPETSSTAD